MKINGNWDEKTENLVQSVNAKLAPLNFPATKNLKEVEVISREKTWEDFPATYNCNERIITLITQNGVGAILNGLSNMDSERVLLHEIAHFIGDDILPKNDIKTNTNLDYAALCRGDNFKEGIHQLKKEKWVGEYLLGWIERMEIVLSGDITFQMSNNEDLRRGVNELVGETALELLLKPLLENKTPPETENTGIPEYDSFRNELQNLYHLNAK